jgi:hypothetical protein
MLVYSHIFNLSLKRRFISFRPQSSISKSNTSLFNRRFRNRANWLDHFCLFFTQPFIPIHHTSIIFQLRNFDFVVMPVLFLDELRWYSMGIMMMVLILLNIKTCQSFLMYGFAFDGLPPLWPRASPVDFRPYLVV